ncbi:4-hydroxy-3-polyprenylbenzoate decarboxylase [Salisediminibacterium halotolerans]|nr:4-hydroxy-3-polyprenylbenzoate decarboxylase [Actinophytocola xinjiangensis]RPE86599.1 4-hydroxy-3-polyprenylbenzoate decarboxylase [Salisediminibacterium halotolerans]TWG33974.1 4-hydroxy-3-polyprenylbenzoate decarboxylase [Salisediminibacterium halotolerans]GEL06618.1 3-octaprenyl-4-hydroxybenzoate carboxy-lyase [Salisediminibacterium halotolerans]
MIYESMEDCVADLEKHGHLLRIKEEVDPNLEMASIHLKTYEAGGPALLFENVKGSDYPAVSNLFGTVERSKFIFRKTWDQVQNIISLRNDPMKAMKHPLQNAANGFQAVKALPWKKSGGGPVTAKEISIDELPLIKHWPNDGGAFITLPQVYSEDPENPGIMNANLGMYRVQLTGNDYNVNREVGMHYQIHRGIGIHQQKAKERGEPLKVSIFIGGPPAHTISSVMPLPEGLSEVLFAGLLSGRRFRYSYIDGYCISHDADFVITGEIYPDDVKPEGPFGDHLGYYSLVHDFPVMKVHKVYARENAVWPFTVVGRPPQEDTSFGEIIHELTGEAIQQEIPGVKEVHAVDAAGVHPLLFAIGSERYTPFNEIDRPQEILTIANRILGTNQLSLAKYLFITAEKDEVLDTHQEEAFITHILERIDLQRDLHFQTKTTIDTLDYSGEGLNKGSKVVIAAYGNKRRELRMEIPDILSEHPVFKRPRLVMPGVIAIEGPAYNDEGSAQQEIDLFARDIERAGAYPDVPLIIICDDSPFIAETFNNFAWAAFTRSNPSHDIHGVNETYNNKHWGCDQMLIDARLKPHHAPPLIPDDETEKNVRRFFENDGPLAYIK